LKLFRDPILEGRLPASTTLGAAGTVVTILAACAVVPLWRLQKTFIFRM